MAEKQKFISGYAALFNEETTIGGMFREKIAPGAFDKSLKERPDVLALFSHNYERVLGRTSAGTLVLRPDRIGLDFQLFPDESTPDGQTAIGTTQRQDIRGCSFGFSVVRETWDEGGDQDLPLRIVEEARLYEISLVSLPAYEATSAKLSEREDKAECANNYQAAKRRVLEKMQRDHAKRGIK